MSGIFHIRPVSVGLEGQFWQHFIYITGCLDVRKISEMMVLLTFVVPPLPQSVVKAKKGNRENHSSDQTWSTWAPSCAFFDVSASCVCPQP